MSSTRFRVLESYDVDDTDPPTGPATFFVEDWLDEDDPIPVDPWFDDRAKAEARADELNRLASTTIEPFCACGRVVSECDGSRRGCGRGAA